MSGQKRGRKTKTYKQTRIPFDGYIKEKGNDAFNYEILEECSLDQLDEREAYWVTKLNAKASGNKFDGGLRNVVGNNNPNAKLTEDDVKKIRIAYNNHLKQKDVYQEFADKISFQYFQNLWQGRAWGHVMPEVFTKENKEYYIKQNSKGENGKFAQFTNEEIIKIRTEYVDKTAKEIYEDYKDRVNFTSFQQILWGRNYSDLPIYKKKEKKWINV